MFILIWMKTAGIDFGNSLVKAVWPSNTGYVSATVDYASLDGLKELLDHAEIQRYHLAGIQSPQYARRKMWSEQGIRLTGNHLQQEIELQARGTRELLPSTLESFLLVSVGTATSYTIVRTNGLHWYNPGSTLGGAFLTHMSTLLGLDHEQFAKEAARGKPLDLYFKDRVPRTKKTPLGNFIIASFGKTATQSSLADICASFVSLTAVDLVSHILDVQNSCQDKPFENVVYIGTPVTKNKVLRKMLRDGTKIIGLKPSFPNDGEYALAIGALVSEEFAKVKRRRR